MKRLMKQFGNSKLDSWIAKEYGADRLWDSSAVG